mmetsp:Transcript_11571/g.21478  ORF Transcript_11571/g.21478 Transcript_11571/m.21478 type:complete len:308 (+) Transcript_11571:94-1017(+)
MASTDDVVLKDQIRVLRAQQQSMKEEKLRLEKSIQSSELKCNALKMEANILAALDEVRFQELEDPVESHSTHDETIFNRQFIEKNLKLELQILNSELRQSLPKLEKQAIRHEDKRNEMSDELRKVKKRIESLPIVSQEELQAQEEALLEKKQLLHEQIDKMNRNSAKERNDNIRTLAKLRAEVNGVDDDLSHERDRAQRFKLLLLDEQGKIEFLREEHHRLRQELEKYHDGKGWQTEAFVSNTSSLDGSLHKSQLPAILNVWLPASEDGSHGVTQDVVADALMSLQLDDREEFTCAEFVTLCDFLSS